MSTKTGVNVNRMSTISQPLSPPYLLKNYPKKVVANSAKTLFHQTANRVFEQILLKTLPYGLKDINVRWKASENAESPFKMPGGHVMTHARCR